MLGLPKNGSPRPKGLAMTIHRLCEEAMWPTRQSTKDEATGYPHEMDRVTSFAMTEEGWSRALPKRIYLR
jgi:hypothetical protein